MGCRQKSGKKRIARAVGPHNVFRRHAHAAMPVHLAIGGQCHRCFRRMNHHAQPAANLSHFGGSLLDRVFVQLPLFGARGNARQDLKFDLVAKEVIKVR